TRRAGPQGRPAAEPQVPDDTLVGGAAGAPGQAGGRNQEGVAPVPKAHKIVLEHARPLPPESAALVPALLGLVLAEDVARHLDMRPYDKAMMDGSAARAADLPDGRATLAVTEESTAGRTPQGPVGPGQAARIMTGAPIPAGADAVVMIERI